MKVNLSNKTIVVVGATGGIGREICKTFKRLGGNVVMAARTKETLVAIQKTLNVANGGGKTLIVQTDATLPSEVETLLETAKKKFKTIDAVVISAGTWKRLSIDSSIEEVSASFASLFGSILMPSVTVGSVAQNFFRKQGFGLIANISSHAAVRPHLKGNLSYSAMKAASRQFILSMRNELAGTGVTVTDIQPAIVNTIEAAGLLDTQKKKRAAVQPEKIALWIAGLVGKKKVPAEKLFDSKLKLD